MVVRNMTRITTTALITLFACAACAQPLKFELASVRRVNGGGPPGDIPRNMDTSPGHFAMRNVPLRMALEWAFDMKDYQISGPDWIKVDERYDIIAKAADPVPESQLRQMLQTLLLERFQMKVHHEMKEMSVYVLLPGKAAPKLKESSPNDQPTLGSGEGNKAGFHAQPVSRFTFMLSRRLDRPVIDKTGLTGRYDFSIDLSGLGFNGKEPQDTNAPSIFTTVQRDLGLRLEATKEPIDVLVIDSVNKIPIEN